MLKWLGIILAAVLVIAVVAFGIGFGIGNGRGNGEGDGTSADKSQELEEEEEDIDYYEGAIYPITVMENDYFYNNERIELDAFIDILLKTDDTVVVEVKDDNASLRAYEKLIDVLKEHRITYVEQ